jgi:HAD superfamily hydrolase (TIGR01549 family)
MIEALFPHIDTNQFIEEYNKVRKKKFPLVSKTLKTFEFLQKHKLKVGILSNKPTEQLWEQSCYLHLHPKKFWFIFGEQSTVFNKPNSKVFDEVLKKAKKAKIKKNEILFVGDLTVDFFAARGAGISFVGVLSGFHSRQKFIRNGLDPKHLIPSIAFLPEWLEENRYIK